MIRDSRLVIAPPAAAAAAPAAKAHELSRQEFEQLLAKPDKLNEPAVAQGLNVAVVPRIARPAANRTVEVVPRDPGSKLVLQQLDRLAPSDAAILIVGESGTGKELVARRVHERSGRRGPFVAVIAGR